MGRSDAPLDPCMESAHLLRRGMPRLRLLWSFLLIGAFFLVEAVTGVVTNSMALLSDAAHMLADVLGLGMALAAMQLSRRASRDRRNTYGLYRLEILAALANSVLLTGVALWIVWRAIVRLGEPPEVDSVPMLVVAALGLGVNLVAWVLLRNSQDHVNVKVASLEMLADALGSVGAISAGVVLMTTGWRYVDPIVGLAIAVFVLPRTWGLGGQAVRILVQAAPRHLDPDAVRADLAAVPGVIDVHDLHLWTLTSDMEVASAHLMVPAGTDMHEVLDGARHVLRERYQVVHATLQIEPDDHGGCEQERW